MKTAVVGCGRMADVHIPYILRTAGAQLVAVCDRDEGSALVFARKYNVQHYMDLSQMLDASKPDVVHVLTPPQAHAAPAIQALKAGCHVLVEKPLCLTGQEVEDIYAAAESAGRIVSVDHTHIWSPLVQQARRLVESGRLGRVLNIQYVVGDGSSGAVNFGFARWALELRGGPFCDMIPHPLYLIRAFLPDARVALARANGSSIFDLQELWVDFSSDGAGAGLWMSLNQRPLEHSMRLYCERGTIHVDLRNFCLSVMAERGMPGSVARLVNTISEARQRTLGTFGAGFGLLLGRFDPKVGTAGAIHAFYRAIAEGAPLPVSRQEVGAVVDLSNAIWNKLEADGTIGRTVTNGAIQRPVNGGLQVVQQKFCASPISSSGKKAPRVLVTGGTGLVGRHLARRLAAEEHGVRVLCRESSCVDVLPTDGVQVMIGDVGDSASVRAAMEGIEVVYHLAAAMSGDWSVHYRGTVLGTQNVFHAAVEAGVKKAVYVSTIGVLHTSRFPNGGRVDEGFPFEPHPSARSDYTCAKLEAEQLAHKMVADGQLNVCIIRPGLVYGPGRAEFASDAGFRIGDHLLVIGLGGRRLPLTYVENLVDALILAGRSDDSCGKVYHIVDPDQPTLREYVQSYRSVTGHRLSVFYIPTVFWTAGFGVLDLVLRVVRGSSPNMSYRLRSMSRGPRHDGAAAGRDLGWKAQVSFERGMRATFDGRLQE